jgi:hypothetical protein
MSLGELLRTLIRAYAELVPTLLKTGPYRIYFYSNESREPPHVHVDRDDRSAKFWLQPVRVVRSIGFSAHELRVIERRVRQWERVFIEAWNEYFGE